MSCYHKDKKVATTRKTNDSYHSHFLAMSFTESFCPPNFARVTFVFEVFVALGAAKTEHLILKRTNTLRLKPKKEGCKI